ncbi:MAG: NAD(P)-binding domain-containing protein, partial [Hungatella sp.]
MKEITFHNVKRYLFCTGKASDFGEFHPCFAYTKGLHFIQKGRGEIGMKIGFIGLGIMGKPMAKNLLKA